MTLEELVAQNLGKPVEREDASNLDQCMDWAFAYVDALGIPRSAIRHLRAYQIWTEATAETKQYFDLIPNTPTGVPPKGALVIFDTTVGVSGHVCIASGNADGLKTFQSTDQNWNGHLYIEYIWHNYNGVLGWLVPKVQSPSVLMSKLTQAEEDALRKARDDNYNNWQAEVKLRTTAEARISKIQDYLNLALKV